MRNAEILPPVAMKPPPPREAKIKPSPMEKVAREA